MAIVNKLYSIHRLSYLHESVDLCKTSLSLVCIAVKAVAVVALKLSKSATVTATEFAADTAVAAPAASFKMSA